MAPAGPGRRGVVLAVAALVVAVAAPEVADQPEVRRRRVPWVPGRHLGPGTWVTRSEAGLEGSPEWPDGWATRPAGPSSFAAFCRDGDEVSHTLIKREQVTCSYVSDKCL